MLKYKTLDYNFDTMEIWDNIITFLELYINLETFGLILTIVVSFIILSIILRGIKKVLLTKIKTKKQISNVTVFLDLMKYIFIVFFIIVVFSSFSNRWGDLGFIAGLLTLALGWALQKPISGVVAWLIIVVRRPFSIGDRVIIAGTKGDITNISLTHIFLDEVGGTIEGEEESRRTVMIPTSVVFEQEIINYTDKDDFILDEIVTTVTYESKLENAERIMITAVDMVMSEYWDSFPKKISRDQHTLLEFKESGINISVRFNTIAMKRNQISTDIRRLIHRFITDSNDVDFAYPHTEIVLKDKTLQPPIFK